MCIRDRNKVVQRVASRADHLEAVQALLDSGAGVDVRASNGETALMLACGKRNEMLVPVLLDNGADVNAKTAFGRTALMAASVYGSLEVVQKLLDKGAEVNARDDDGKTALMIACKYNRDVVRALLDKGAVCLLYTSLMCIRWKRPTASLRFSPWRSRNTP